MDIQTICSLIVNDCFLLKISGRSPSSTENACIRCFLLLIMASRSHAGGWIYGKVCNGSEVIQSRKNLKKVAFRGSKIRRIAQNIYQLFIYFQTELFVWDPMKNLNLPQNNQFVGLQKRRISAIWSFLLLVHTFSQKRVVPVPERSGWEISQRLGNWKLWWLCHPPRKPETDRYMHFVHHPSFTLFCVFTCLITSPIIFEVKLSLPRKQLEWCYWN